MAAVIVVAAVASACSVSGEAVPTPDLSSKAVPSSDFPYGAGQPVPSAQVPGILADITFRPMRGRNDPADCTPAAVDTATAQVRVGPGGPAQGTLTAMVVRATDSFDDFLSEARRCTEFALGGTVGTAVATTVDAADPSAGTVQLERRLRMGPAPSAQDQSAQPPSSSVTEFVAQQGDVRVYVQNRRPGGTALGADELAATRTLFDAARASAFGG
ncbi:hypothetical protein [Gordonia neofelifaecis]|uniref:hypothetical protein n=1 Tax=Gordonia neofelifaecis TaxID=945692 RepID=UPI0002D5C3B8|nr:hypothetical protein [Gordonia neofelifaecis]